MGMRDSVLGVAVTGFVGAAAVDTLSFLSHRLGMNPKDSWEIAAEIFLRGVPARTPVGIILGLIATVGLSMAAAGLTLLLLRWTGTDFAWLKGTVGANVFGFVTLGLFMPLLHIWPAMRDYPLAYVAALINLSIMGLIQGLLLSWWIRPMVRG